MPLPLLLVGAVVGASALSGLVKGVGAQRDFDQAQDDNNVAKATYDDAQAALLEARKHAQARLEALGERKRRTYEDGLIPFVRCFDQIKRVEFDRDYDFGTDVPDFASELPELRQLSTDMAKIFASALEAGALVGLAAYGSVGVAAPRFIGTATVTATLSRAAATNATLAWLRGGSLAAGASGTILLGGVVGASVLLVGGFLVASKAEEAKETAKSNLLKAKAAAEAMKTASVATRAIGRKAAEVNNLLAALYARHFAGDLAALTRLVAKNADYRTYSRGDRKLVARTLLMAVTLKNVAQAPLLEDDGSITGKIRKALQEGRELLRKLDAVSTKEGS